MTNAEAPPVKGGPPGRRFVQLVSVAAEQNRFRSYAITVERLDDEGRWLVIRRWGRIGSEDREMVTEHGTYAEAVAAAEQTAQKRLSRGYAVVTSR
jgi:predicted DNA-binding WGR domain protein